jgi:hypothetical protein
MYLTKHTCAPPKGPYPCGTNPLRHARAVYWLQKDNASARAQWIGKAVDADLMTSAIYVRQSTDLERRGRSVPKPKRLLLRASFIRHPNRARRQASAGLDTLWGEFESQQITENQFSTIVL